MNYGDGKRPEIEKFVPAGTRRLLDVGCGRGGFAEGIAAKGIDVWAVEPDVDAASVAAERVSRLILGSYPHIELSGCSFDCIVFNDILEHCVEPLQLLLEAKKQLSDSGVVIASIPNIRHASIVLALLRSGRWDYTDAGILDRTHLRFFTKDTMRELFEEAGYRVTTQQPINVVEAGGFARAFRLLGRETNEQLLATQYVTVGTPSQ